MILYGFTLKRREDGPLLQLARLALIVATPSRYGGPRGRLARRRRRGPEGLRAASGAQASDIPPDSSPGDRRELRRVRISVILKRRSAQERRPGRARRAPRAFNVFVKKVLTGKVLGRLYWVAVLRRVIPDAALYRHVTCRLCSAGVNKAVAGRVRSCATGSWTSILPRLALIGSRQVTGCGVL